MEILQIVAFGILATILVTIVKEFRPEFAVQISLVAGLMIFVLVISRLRPILDVLEQLASHANLNLLYLGTVFKIVGIAYITEFGAQVCRDAGEGAIAIKIELAGKILITLLAIPILIAIMETVLKLLG